MTWPDQLIGNDGKKKITGIQSTVNEFGNSSYSMGLAVAE